MNSPSFLPKILAVLMLIFLLFSMDGPVMAQDEDTIWESQELSDRMSGSYEESIERILEQGYSRMARGELDEARDLFERADRLRPGNGDVKKALGDYFLRIGMYQKAVESYEQSLLHQGDPVRLNFLIGKCYFLDRNYPKAVEHLEKLSTTLPDGHEAEYHHILGESLLRTGQLDRAEKSLDMAIRLDGNLLDAHMGLGQIYQERGVFRKAREHYRIILNHKDADGSMKAHVEKQLREMSSQAFQKRSWQLMVPLGVFVIIIPLFFILKKKRERYGEKYEEEEEVEDFYG